MRRLPACGVQDGRRIATVNGSYYSVNEDAVSQSRLVGALAADESAGRVRGG